MWNLHEQQITGIILSSVERNFLLCPFLKGMALDTKSRYFAEREAEDRWRILWQDFWYRKVSR